MPRRHRDAQFLEQRPGAQGKAGPRPSSRRYRPRRFRLRRHCCRSQWLLLRRLQQFPTEQHQSRSPPTSAVALAPLRPALSIRPMPQFSIASSSLSFLSGGEEETINVASSSSASPP